MNNVKGWSPDCENASNTNKFDFAVQVIVVDTEKGEEFVGPWSDNVTVAAYCSQSLSWTIIIVVCVVVAVAAMVLVMLVCRASHWWLLKKDFFDKLGKELDAKFVLASVDSLDGGGAGQNNSGPEFELRQFDIRQGGDESKEDPGDTDTLLLRGSSSSPGQPPHRHKSASESAQSDFTTSGFGGSSQGCTTTTVSSDCCSGRLHPQAAPLSEAGSSVSGYISMMGRADSSQSNYTQLGLGRPAQPHLSARSRTLSGPRPVSGTSPGDSDATFAAYTGAQGPPNSFPHPAVPEEGPVAAEMSVPCTPLGDTGTGTGHPIGDQQQLGLSDWNSFPGYSLVTTGPPPALSAGMDRRINGYVPAQPALVAPPSTVGTQVGEFSAGFRILADSLATLSIRERYLVIAGKDTRIVPKFDLQLT